MSSLKNIKSLRNFIVNPIKTYIESGEFRRNRRYAHYYENMKLKKYTILYECREGKSMTGNAYAIYNYMCSEKMYNRFNHIWVVDCEEKKIKLEKENKCNKTSFVVIHSREYLKALASSKYLINNSTFPSYFQSKKGQIYINTWHGTPLKYMGKDIIDEPLSTKNITRNFVHTDYLVMPNRYTIDIFKKAYYIDGIYEGKIIEEGYPRIDLTINTNRDKMKNKLISMGLNITLEKELILYAPTWKGSDLNRPNNDLDRIIEDINSIKSNIDQNRYDVVIKVHPFLFKYVKKIDEMKAVCIDDEIDTNMLLGAVDILITDYSSIFFDYLVTRKPILFYMWDKSVYEGSRGLYIEDKELPGPIVHTVEAVSGVINKIEDIRLSYREIYNDAINKFCKKDDGKATKRVVDAIFNIEKDYNIYSLKDEKQSMLIYLGGMKNNGITSSAINLLNNIDYSKYNVSILVSSSSDKEIVSNIEKINANAKKFIRIGRMNFKFNEAYRERYVMTKGKKGKIGNTVYPRQLFKREFERLFGKTKFDFIIDFSGYSMFWDNIILQGKAKKKIIYMHNDLLADSERIINGKKVHELNLKGVFSILDEFDSFASVSPACREINKKNLAQYADVNKFKYILNSINTERILYGSTQPMNRLESEEYLICNKSNQNVNEMTIKLASVMDRQYINIVSLGNMNNINVHLPFLKKMEGMEDKKVRLYIIGYEKVDSKLIQSISQHINRDNIIVVDEVNNISALLVLSDYIIYNDTSIRDYRYVYQLNTLKDKWNKPCLVQSSIENRILLDNNKINYINEEFELLEHLKQFRKEKLNNNEEVSIDGLQDEILKVSSNGEKCIVENVEYFFAECVEQLGCKEVLVKKSPDNNNINFINIGRLSPEKDQEKLLHAFKRVNDKYKNTRLYILGEGPLYNRLQEVIGDLQLESSVYLLGQVSNPFYLLNQCDCFILSSNYEGQPMVLLEAMTLGKNIIATDIPQNRYVLQDGYGKLAENSVAGLAKEMEDFIVNGMTTREFDYNGYNEKAMESFYTILND